MQFLGTLAAATRNKVGYKRDIRKSLTDRLGLCIIILLQFRLLLTLRHLAQLGLHSTHALLIDNIPFPCIYICQCCFVDIANVFFSLSLFLRILFDVVFPLKKKNMGISGAMVPEKTCTSRLCTHEHTINVIAPTLRETVIYTFQTAVCRCLSNTSLLPLTLETLCVGFFCWHFASFCTIAYTSLFLSPLAATKVCFYLLV